MDDISLFADQNLDVVDTLDFGTVNINDLTIPQPLADEELV